MFGTHKLVQGRYLLVYRAICVVVIMCLIGPTVAVAQQPPPQPGASVPPAGERAVERPEVRGDTGIIAAGTRILPGPDYRLGPGDLLEVQIVGRLETARHQVTVDLEGAISIPQLGVVEVRGLTLSEAYRRLVERARTIFRFVDVSVSLLAPRSFEVVVTGEVERPGAPVIPALRRLQEIIAAVGGITPRGSLRRIKVTQKGAEREIDLLRFQLQGDLTQNPFVEEGMKIQVPPRGPSVTLSGAVRRPGEYEIGPTGSLAELLALVGGLQQSALRSEARLTRIGPDGRKETFALDLVTALARPADVILQPGDSLVVPSLAKLQDVVEVRGAFVGTSESSKTTTAGKPTVVQRLELAHGERVRDVVAAAGGLSPLADLRVAVVERDGVTGPRERIPIDLHRLFVEKDEAQNIRLRNGDVLTVPVVEDKVFVVGEVKSPGSQDYRPELTAREYVTIAGGPTSRGRPTRATVTFRDGRSYAMADAPPLEPGAVVTIPEVAVKWYQDYVLIAQTVASLIVGYTGLFVLFGGRVTSTTP